MGKTNSWRWLHDDAGCETAVYVEMGMAWATKCFPQLLDVLERVPKIKGLEFIILLNIFDMIYCHFSLRHRLTFLSMAASRRRKGWRDGVPSSIPRMKLPVLQRKYEVSCENADNTFHPHILSHGIIFHLNRISLPKYIYWNFHKIFMQIPSSKVSPSMSRVSRFMWVNEWVGAGDSRQRLISAWCWCKGFSL